jgi:APA family basic amino acid/polyamine antiporter
MKLYPLLPLLFILAYIFVGTVIAITNPEYSVTGLSVLAVFIVLYFIFHKKDYKEPFNDNDLLQD